MTQSHTKPTSCFSTYSHALENNCRTGGEIQFDLLYQFPAVGHEPRFKALPRLYPCLPAETFFVRVEKMPPARGGRNQYPVIRKRLFRIEIERENKIAADESENFVRLVGLEPHRPALRERSSARKQSAEHMRFGFN